MYDQNNIFAKIISGSIATPKLYEDDILIAIKDKYPDAPIHILVLPKAHYIDFADFTTKASTHDIAHYFKMVAKIAKENGAEDYRIITNKGALAGQSIFHFHTHILSGLTNINLIDKHS